MALSVRRIIAAPTRDGSRILSDGAPPELMEISEEGGMGGAVLWATGATPTIEIDAGEATKLYPGYFPSPGETRVLLVAFAPGAVAEMHATDTIDTVMVIEGEIELHVDHGPPTLVRTGDVVICFGANHKWVNTGTKVTKFCSTLVGATRP